MLDEVILRVYRGDGRGRGPVPAGCRVLVSQHRHLVLHRHSQPQELVVERGGAEEDDALGVWHLVTRDGALGGHLDGVVVEQLEGDGVQVVDIFGVVC